MLKEGKCLAVSFLENSLSFPGVLLEEPKEHTESHMDTLDAMSSASKQELASELISFIKKDTHHFGKGKPNVGSMSWLFWHNKGIDTFFSIHEMRARIENVEKLV